MRYMIIDVTTLADTRLITTAGSIRQAEHLGLLEKEKGRMVIAPPLDGRGFAKLPLLQLQYLLWNSFATTPPDTYEEVVKLCLDKVKATVDDESSLEALERRTAHLSAIPGGAEGSGKPKVERDPSAPPERPKGTTTTGLVWEIADKCFVAAGNKVDRKAIITACEAEGINPSTAATQYSKWKKAKEGSSSVPV